MVIRWTFAVTHSNWPAYTIPFLFGALIAAIAAVIEPFGLSHFLSACLGLSGVALATLLAVSLGRARGKRLLGGFLGLFAGSLLGFIFLEILNAATLGSGQSITFLRLATPILLAYVGLSVGIAKSDRLPFSLSAPEELTAGSSGKVLDTSVLIDGRISDIVESGFLEGPLVVPRFVLHELQVVADSSDSARRARGRRGLDVVQRLQNLPDLKVEVSQQDFPATREVDLKLIEFAKLRAAKIVTNDFNLNKLAQVQGIHVLNINELASSLKPVVLPGEIMRVFILKEGKEHNQGIAYLDDGTMVVVDNARRMISKHIDIIVTSVLQTTAGKMIFGRYDERSHPEARPISASAST
jgi:uncharacterized protein YacL